MTADTIRRMAEDYNRAFPEAVAEIAAGTPVLDVSASLADHVGRRLRFVATLGVVCPDGGFIAAEDPRAVTVTRRDGRVGREILARRRYAREAAAAGVELRVRVVGC